MNPAGAINMKVTIGRLQLFLLAGCCALILAAVTPAQAAETSFSCDVYSGFNYATDQQATVGYITSLQISGTGLNADFTVRDPLDPANNLNVVGILSAVSWGGGYAEPIYLSSQLSVPNKNIITQLLHTTLTDLTVQINFVVYEYDPVAKRYFKAFSPGDGLALAGLIAKSGGELLMTVAAEQSTEVLSPANYTFSLGVMPQECAQSIQLSFSTDDHLVKQWGIEVEGGSGCVVGNTAPTFSGATTTLTVIRNAGATDIKSLLHVSDTDTGQTETWSQSAAPSHGTLSFSGATASSGSADITPGGTITYTPTAGYSGSDSFTVQVSDGTATATRTITVVVVTTPITAISTVVLSADTGRSSTDFITRTAAQTISGTLSANLASGETVYVSLNNGGTWTAAASVGPNSWSLAGQTLTGSNTLKVKVSNAAGDGPVYSQSYVLDTVIPATTIATAAFSSDTGSSSTDFITKTAAQTISGTLSANLAAGEVVEVSLDNGSTWTTATTSVGQNIWSLAGQTLTGSNTLKVRVTDTAGNSGTVFSQTYILDNSSPAIASVSVPDSATYSTGRNLDFIVNWSENVAVTDTSSALGLTIGSSARSAGYQSHTASSITYRYTVQNGDIDTDGIAVVTLTLNGSTIEDTAGNNAALTLNSVSSTLLVRVDGLVPTAATASGISSSGFTANWNAHSGATGYRLDVAVDSGFTDFVTGLNNIDVGSVTSYKITGLVGNSSYHYRIRAYNADGTSASSNTISVTTFSGTITGIIADSEKLYAGFDGAGIYRSLNSGGNWVEATTQPTNLRVKALAIKPGDSATLFAATYGDGLFKSTNSGIDWIVCDNTGLTNLNIVTLTIDSNGKLYAGTEAGVFVSTDGCASWMALNNGLP